MTATVPVPEAQAHADQAAELLDRAWEKSYTTDPASVYALIGAGNALLAIDQRLADMGQDAAEAQMLATLRGEADAARAELARVDSKVGLLLGLSTAAAAGIVTALMSTTAVRLSTVTVAGLWATGGLLAAAVALLLVVVRPRMPKAGGTGFLACAAAATDEELLHHLEGASQRERLAAHVRQLSRIARAKYVAVRRAVDALLCALAVLAVTLPFAGM